MSINGSYLKVYDFFKFLIKIKNLRLKIKSEHNFLNCSDDMLTFYNLQPLKPLHNNPMNLLLV